MPLVVRVRPNAAYLVTLAAVVVVLVGGILAGGAVGVAMVVAGGVLTVLFGYPVVASTLMRVPAVVVGPEGLRLPLMGVRLDWRGVADVRSGIRMRSQVPVLLVVPRDPAAVIARLRPWLRREARTDLAMLGAPIVINARSLDHGLDQIRAAIEASRVRG